MRRRIQTSDFLVDVYQNLKEEENRLLIIAACQKLREKRESYFLLACEIRWEIEEDFQFLLTVCEKDRGRKGL